MDPKIALDMAYGYLNWIEKGEEQLAKDVVFLNLIGNNLKAALQKGDISLASALLNWLEIAEQDVNKVKIGIDVATNNLRTALDNVKAGLE